MQKDSRLAWGISLLVFGLLFLIRQMDVLPLEVANLIFSYKNYPLILGLIFLFAQKNKTSGLILIVVAILFRITDIIRITRNVSDYIWPVLLIAAGVVLLISSTKRKK